jgi:hypothetical protein
MPPSAHRLQREQASAASLITDKHAVSYRTSGLHACIEKHCTGTFVFLCSYYKYYMILIWRGCCAHVHVLHATQTDLISSVRKGDMDKLFKAYMLGLLLREQVSVTEQLRSACSTCSLPKHASVVAC